MRDLITIRTSASAEQAKAAVAKRTKGQPSIHTIFFVDGQPELRDYVFSIGIWRN